MNKNLVLEIERGNGSFCYYDFTVSLYNEENQLDLHETAFFEIDEDGIDFCPSGLSGAYVKGLVDGVLATIGISAVEEFKTIEEEVKKNGKFSKTYNFSTYLEQWMNEESNQKLSLK